MLDVFGGLGLASAAGLNAYIPALLVGLLARFTDLVALPSELELLSNGWVLLALAVLLAVEIVVDKVPGADHLNDVVQTVVRPASGAMVFAAEAKDTFGGNLWVSAILGVVAALTMHGTKAAGRGIANVSTAGFSAPVLSVIEDVVSIGLSVLAILVPVLVVAVLLWWAWVWWRVVRWRRKKRAQRVASTN